MAPPPDREPDAPPAAEGWDRYEPCRTCDGRGWIDVHPCHDCWGTG